MNHLFESPCKNRKDLMNQLWKNFSSEKVQEGLSVLSNRFIYEYLELMEKINSSPESIWNLKEKYLIQLSDYIGSPSGKKRTIKQVPTAEIEEVLKAEQTFPSVKIISQDPEINDIKINLSRLSQLQEHKIDFLLIGETGTGKELFAKAISESSNRRGKFVAINCAEISHDLIESKLFGHKKGAFTDAKEDHKGYFEQANEGTLFLDEIGELGMELQAKLLRAVQEKEIQPLGAEGPKKIDVRMIFATNRDLDKMVELREFRRDLLQRINRFTFRIPPLRERKMDIPILADYFIHEYDKDRQKNPELEPLQIAPECVDLLNNHQWKGNVRELENVISNVVIMKAAEHDRTPITAADLPQHFAGRTDILLKTTHKNRSLPGNMKVTDDQIREAMEQCNNNKSEVARRLGVDKRTIRRRWKNLEI